MPAYLSRLKPRQLREELFHAVFNHTVLCRSRTEGWLTDQGACELREAEDVLAWAQAHDIAIPSIYHAQEWVGSGEP